MCVSLWVVYLRRFWAAKLKHVPGVNVDQFISHMLGGVLILVALALVIQPIIRTRLWPKDQPVVFFQRLEVLRKFRTPILIAIGVVVGVLVGLTSVGGGSVIMIALSLVYPRWMMNRRVGTDVLQGFFLSTAAALGHWQLVMSIFLLLLSF